MQKAKALCLNQAFPQGSEAMIFPASEMVMRKGSVFERESQEAMRARMRTRGEVCRRLDLLRFLEPSYQGMLPWAFLLLLPHCDPYTLSHYDPVLPLPHQKSLAPSEYVGARGPR